MANVATVPPALATLDRARLALEAVETVEDARLLADEAEALRHLAHKSKAGLEMQNRCAEIRLRAERRGGQLLTGMELKPGPKGNGDTLGAIGIERHQSSRWQRIASLPEPEFDAYIASAFNDHRELTTNGALQLARLLNAQDPAQRPRLRVVQGDGLPGLEGTFTTIVADPPWQYDNRGTRNAAAKHYPTLSIEELCELPVPAHVAGDAHLYLWTTAPFLRQAFDVVEAWGFEYKTNLVWTKPQMGMGNYFRVSHEHVLFGVRGSLATRRRNTMSWFEADRARHSSKPDAFYDLVESCSAGPFLELFGRRRRLGDWAYWGNES